MIAEKGFVGALLHIEAFANFSLEPGDGVGVAARNLIGAHPGVDFIQRGVVGDHDVVQVALRRVVRIGQRHRIASVLLHEIADGLRLVGGQQRAQKADGEIAHAVKLSLVTAKYTKYPKNFRRNRFNQRSRIPRVLR